MLRPQPPKTRRKARPGLVVYAPAKINVYLRVVGRRADGYHLLESIVAPVSCFDRLWLHPRADGEIRLRCNDPCIPSSAGNLAWRAAALLRERAGVDAGVDISLLKRIPAGAGLGGGSSDAAAVLIGLNRLWRLGFSTARLARLGAILGADVPFFVHGRPAVMRGVGERVRPFSAFPHADFVLAFPGSPIETRWVYQNLHWSEPTPRPRSPVRRFLQGRLDLASILHNDLERVACKAQPAIARLLARLGQLGGSGGRMTGSGSAVFGIFPSSSATKRAAARLRREGLWAVAVRTIDKSPALRNSRSPPNPRFVDKEKPRPYDRRL
jgi:4-diphosphocytidyl-2-C-methyl-D-erythritol kinase